MGHGPDHAAQVGGSLGVRILLQCVSVGAGVTAFIALVVGAFLLFTPRRFFEGATPLRRLIFEANIGEPFSRRFAIERRVYRRHRIVGSAVIAGGCALATFAGYLAGNPRALHLFAIIGTSGLRVAIVLVVACALLLFIVGFCLVIRPSVLKGIEAAANRWVDTKSPGPTLSSAVLRHPRLVGVLLFVGAALNLRLL